MSQPVVLFIQDPAAATEETEEEAYVFTVSTDGGEPVKVSDDVSFLCNSVGYTHLFEWR
jgi:hypothetical protein